jgi:hypothetical protein
MKVKVRWDEADPKHLGHAPLQRLLIGDRKPISLTLEEARGTHEALVALAEMGCIEYSIPEFSKDYG